MLFITQKSNFFYIGSGLKSYFMKQIRFGNFMQKLAFILLLIFGYKAPAQMGVGVFAGSQLILKHDTNLKSNYFSTGFDLRYQRERFMYRLAFRKLSGAKKFSNANIYQSDVVIGQTNVETQLEQTGWGFGIGFTFEASSEKSRPYIMFQLHGGTYDFRLTGSGVSNINPVSLGSYYRYTNESDIGEFTAAVFTSGFQFELLPSLCINTEASIYLGQLAPYYYKSAMFALEFGGHFYFDRLKK